MDREPEEVYERIPWETLEKGGGDRQWMIYVVAGAVVLGALAYSFARSQPTPAPIAAAVTVSTQASVTTTTTPITSPSTVAAPVVVSEADLYAVDRETLARHAASLAEWFAVEYMSIDGSEQSAEVLAALLPPGLPLPEAPEGTQVYVDWAGVKSVVETGPLEYEVEVVVRTLAATGNSGFVRQHPRLIVVPVTVDEDGAARIGGAPRVETATPELGVALDLAEIPDELQSQVESSFGPVVGGVPTEDGTWEVVVMMEGPDGVRRPVTVSP